MDPSKSPISCTECGTHYLVSPGEVQQGSPSCPECGGRMFRDQPSTIMPEMPGPDSGHLMDFLPAAADGQTSPTGGNPLDEGTIMGSDGERPAGKRDNSFVGKVAGPYDAPCPSCHGRGILSQGPPVQYCPTCQGTGKFPALEATPPYGGNDGGTYPDNAAQAFKLPVVDRNDYGPVRQGNTSHPVAKHMMPETFRQDIYPALWHDKTADNTNMFQGGDAPGQPLGPGGYETPANRAIQDQGMSPGQWAELGGATALGLGTLGVGTALAPEIGAGAELATGGGAAAEQAIEQEAGKEGPGLAQQALGQGAAGLAKGTGEGLIKSISPLMENVLGLGAGGTGQGMSQAPGMVQTGSIQDIPMLLLADFETYDSNPILDTQDDGSHGFDQKEFSVGDQTPSNMNNPNLQDSGANGEDNARSDSSNYTGFASNSPGIERAQEMLPKLLQMHDSEEAGTEEPTIAGLHAMLEAENPGYLSNPHPESDMALQQLLDEHRNPNPMGVHAKTATGPLHRSPNLNYDLGDAQFQSPNGVNDIRMNVSPLGQGEVHDPNLSPRDPRHSIPIGGDDSLGTVMMQGVPEVPGSASFPGRSGIPGVYDRLEENGFDWGNVLPIRQGYKTAIDMMPGGQPTTTPMPGAPPMNGIPQPQQPGGQCPNCGGVMGPGGSCPQCGNGNTATNVPPMPMGMPGMPPAMAGIAYHLATHQGPVTPQQISEVQELLVNWEQTHPGVDRSQEAPNVPLHPEQYASEMAEIQHNPNVAPQIDPSQLQQTPPPAMQQAPGAMPVTDPSQPGGGGGQPMQPMSSERTADANTNVARCPRCQSGSTSVDIAGDPSQITDPMAKCHSCHLIFDPSNPEAALKKKKKKSKTILLAGEIDLPNPHMLDHFRFADAEGNDLVEGGTYELRTGATLPTEIKVLQVKPDGLDVQLVGGIGGVVGAPDFRISRQKAEMGKYTFVPLSLPQGAQSTDPNTTPGQSAEQVPPFETTDESPDVSPHTVEASFENRCGSCGSSMVDSSMADMLTTDHDCVKCGNHWQTREEDFSREAGLDLSWLDEDMGTSDRHMHMERAVGGQSRSLSDVASKDPRLKAISQALAANKIAGKDFNSSEKRELIDEKGNARNLEDLDLDGTHYEARVDYSGMTNEMNVEDDHFALGL